MKLPELFLERMKHLLGDEYEDFIKSYDEKKAYGLRINPLKIIEADKEKLPFKQTPVAWAKEGYYVNPEERPGRHPLHEAGAYYIQEPSAMSVVSLLEPQPGEVICDMCAAPGGKSTQIAGRMNGTGLLVSNEIFTARAKILSQNIERLGITNAVVCNEPPDRMALHFPDFFDRIVVDAPCSGEGMFRKDETAIKEWSPENVAICADRQKMILEYADTMLKKGGTLVYSTCTFSPDEDENMLLWFLRKYPEYTVIDWHKTDICREDIKNTKETSTLESGRVDFVSEDLLPLSDTEKQAIHNSLRLWPHKLNGEGHFAVRLQKGTIDNTVSVKNESLSDYENDSKKAKKKKKGNKEQTNSSLSKAEIKEYTAFIKSIVTDENETYTLKQTTDRLRYFGNELYLVPACMKNTDGIKIIRAGLHIATRKKDRFEPAHAWAKALSPNEAISSVDCDLESANKYLHGETIPCDTTLNGWILVCYEGISLGFGKASGGVIKNHYPKGLRTL